MSQQENLLGVIGSIFRYKKFIIIICILTGLGSAGLSLLLKNYYKASTLFYAAHPDLQNPEKIFGTSTSETYYYGSDSDIDRLISIAKSNVLTDYLIDKFNLYDHYEIDTTHPKAPFFVKKELLKLYNVQKTKLDAIELSIEDLDPQLSAAMANAAREKIDALSTKLVKESQSNMETAIRESISSKVEILKILSDSLAVLRDLYGVYDLETQSEVIASQLAQTETSLFKERAIFNALKNNESINRDTLTYIKARLDGLEKSYKELTSSKSVSKINVQRFNAGYNIVSLLSDEFEKAQTQLNKDRERLKLMTAAQDASISSVHLIASAKVPIIKSRPKRSILVISAVMMAFLFSMIAVLLYDTYKDVKWKEIINGK